ncbi:helix-turn-helix transcriptional regulator [Blastococcus xanthinilyticus]|uniref:Putative ArsR family transcriptional regulator n=1 Tax=Blastococcus xanthinilyticus TaxID=1564164 RepID=A0A5S5D7H0_9ACTN|nr:metalloregulator ArsR/SmtB family transcription factor [Blastococcus xanthinilyticus]TYP90559.1 putative ArsR family transcriptional regulator [Blastococcus xanthinilyticus]
MESIAAHPRPSAPADDGRTRDRVSALLLEHGPQTATELATRLGISPAAVRRHLDALLATARVEERQSREAHRGRGRPARRFHLTDAGRSAFPHAYDDLALTALRYVAEAGGLDAVRAVAERQLAGLEQRASTAVQQAVDARPGEPVDRAQALAAALTAEGYAATASALSGGGQLCQHHCPVAHVAAEFPQLCEAETAVIGRLVGTHVQRLATIAHGDGICTTHIPGPLVPGTGPGRGRDHSRAGNRTDPARPVPGERGASRPARARTAPSSTTTPTNDRERTPA